MNQDIIYQAMLKICSEQDIDFRQYTSSEFLEDLEEAIIKVADNYWVNIKKD